MSSPARKHLERTLAALAISEGSSDERAPENANQYELMLAKLAEDKRRLSSIQSMEKRADLKLVLLPEYEPWVEGVLKSNHGVQDDVLMTVMVWCIDAGLLSAALDIAAYAIKHKLKMPDQYERSAPVVIAEEIADICIKQHAADAVVPIDIIQRVMEITDGQDMPDQVKAKLYKTLGFALLNPALVPDQLDTEANRLDFALQSFKKAVSLHDNVGVKKHIEKLERDIKNLAAAQ